MLIIYILIGLLSASISAFFSSFIPIYYASLISSLLTESNNLYDVMLSYIFYKILANIFGGIRGFLFSIIMFKHSAIKKNKYYLNYLHYVYHILIIIIQMKQSI